MYEFLWDALMGSDLNVRFYVYLVHVMYFNLHIPFKLELRRQL